MDLGLKGKRALVTGGSRGIGKAVALALAREGVDIAVVARGYDDLNRTCDEIEAFEVKAVRAVCDVSQPSAVVAMFDVVASCFGRLDILINNAGGGGRWGDPDPLKTPERVWEDVVSKNFGATLRLTMKALPLMQAQNWGRVVTITSVYGNRIGGRPWFNVAKTAQNVLMKNLATHHDYARHNITFNCVAPGPIMIPGTGWEQEQGREPEKFQEYTDSLPLGRLGRPEEVADIVAFLCSERASLINGASIIADGGESPVL